VSTAHYARHWGFAGLVSVEYCQTQQEERLIMSGMHRVLTGVVLVALTATAVPARLASQARQSRQSTEQALIALENEWAKAVV
jgi:hypothetical protein